MNWMIPPILWVLISIPTVLLFTCVGAGQTFGIESDGFSESSIIPVRFTCAGENLSPPLRWHNVPSQARSLSLICHDPDAPAGDWIHWIVVNIPADTTGLSEGIGATSELPDGAVQGRNGFGKNNYGGPCPPPGKPHRYFFKLYALDIVIRAVTPLTREAVEEAMKGHILAETSLMGRFGR